MILTGTLKLADNTLICFYENGEVLRTVKGQNSRITLNEATMYINNAASYTHGSKSYMIDGQLVTYANFVKAVDSLEMSGPHISDAEYVEQYTVHKDITIEDAEAKVLEPEAPIVTTVESEDNTIDEDELDAVVVNPEDAGNWWE